MLAAVELVSALARRTGDTALIAAASRQLESFSQVEFGARHRDLALRLARAGRARGADTAIAAQVVVVAEASTIPVEFLTADEPQVRLVERERRRAGSRSPWSSCPSDGSERSHGIPGVHVVPVARPVLPLPSRPSRSPARHLPAPRSVPWRAPGSTAGPGS
jgi:hypothetical protein